MLDIWLLTHYNDILYQNSGECPIFNSFENFVLHKYLLKLDYGAFFCAFNQIFIGVNFGMLALARTDLLRME